MHHMQHTLKNKKVPIAVALGGFLASAIVFQGVFSRIKMETFYFRLCIL